MERLSTGLVILYITASGVCGAEVWRSDFATGPDGVLTLATPNQVLLPKVGAAEDGRLTVNNFDQLTGLAANKAGRPLGVTVTGGEEFSALYRFRWSELWTGAALQGYGAFDLVCFFDPGSTDFTRQVLGAAINHYRDPEGIDWLRLNLAVGGNGIGSGQWWYGTGTWVKMDGSLVGRDLQLVVAYSGASQQKTLRLVLLGAAGDELARREADLAAGDCPARTFVNSLSLSHLGWSDYTGVASDAGQAIRSVWQADVLAFFNTADGAMAAALSDTSQPPTWTSLRQHRLLVRVNPLAGLPRTTDELVARVDVDFTTYLGQQPVDLSSLQVVRYAPETGAVLAYAGNAYATTNGERPLRFYDDTVPWQFPDRAANANDTQGEGTPIVYMPGGGRYFNPLGESRRGKLAWVHTQDGTAPSYYAIYFDGLPGGIPSQPAPAGFLGDGGNRCTTWATQFAPTIHGRVDTADLNGDGLFDLVWGNATGTILFYPNVGLAGNPSFRYAKLLFDVQGAPLDVGWSSAPRIVDWDSDGKLDLIVGAEMAGVVLYFRNEGTSQAPVFRRMGLLKAQGQAISAPASPCEEDPGNAIFTRDYYPVPDVVDWDGDGDRDLLLGGYITGRVWLYENVAASPNIEPQLLFRGALKAVPPSGGSPVDLDVTWCAAPTAADFDGDGDLDLMSGAMQMTEGGGDLSDPERFLWYFENVGTRTSPQLVWRPFPKQGQFTLGLLGTPRPVDFNLDGRPDLVVSSMGSLLLLPNIGTPRAPLYNAATPQTGFPRGNAPLPISQLVDQNGDGWPDLFTGTAVQLNTGTGAPGLFGTTIPLPGAAAIYHASPSGDHWDYRAFADMDNDLLRDILVGDHQGYVWFHRDQGTPGSPQIDAIGYRLQLTTGEPLRVGTVGGGGGFDELQGARTVVAPGDFNHDGWRDLVVGDTYGYIRLFLRPPGGAVVFEPPLIVGRPVATRLSAQAIDWNGDGWDDLLVSYASAVGDQVYLYVNSAQAGTPVFSGPTWIDLGKAWGWPMLFVGDWNRDGDEDILLDQYGYTRYIERSFVEHGYRAGTLLASENRNGSSPTGACCQSDGSCSSTTALQCPGNWRGAGIACAQVSCPQPGACCLSDGACVEVPGDTCSGTWHGEGVSCAVTQCAQPGACCHTDGSCSRSLEASCVGAWQGGGTDCQQSDCSAVTGEIWRSTFNDGTPDGVLEFLDGDTDPEHTPVGAVASGSLEITTWDYDPADPNDFKPDKVGRPLGLNLTGGESFSGLYVFRWTALSESPAGAFAFAGFMGDQLPYQTRPVCGALLRHYRSGPDYRVDLGIGFGSVGYTWFGTRWGPTINLGVNPTPNTYQLAIGYNGVTHVLSVGLFDASGNLLGRLDPDLDTDVVGLQSPGTPEQEIGGLVVNHLGWMDYRQNGGNLPTVWQVDTLIFFSRAQGAFTELQRPRRAPADFDRNGYVDGSDLVHFVNCALGADVHVDAACEDADLDGDGDVDMDDFGRLQRCYAGGLVTADPDCAG